MSTAVLKLQESGRLAQLKNKWWKEKKGGGKCSVSELNKILYNIGNEQIVHEISH